VANGKPKTEKKRKAAVLHSFLRGTLQMAALAAL
jgi:hypothetical protein